MLTDEQVRAFREDGFTVCEDFLSQTEVDALLQEADGAIEGNTLATHDAERMEMEPEQPPDGGAVRRLYEPCTYYPVSRALSEMDKLLDSVQQLFGPNLLFHYSKLNMKPPRVGSVVEWHQDLAYFPHTNDDLVTTLIYLDDATEENGCLQVMPRHHSHYFDHRLPDGTFAGMITETVSDGRYGPPKALPAPAGSAIFMHCVLPHSSLPNRSEKARRTLIYEYRAADAVPLHVGPYTEHLEEFSCHLQGNEARFARFGGPAPSLPVMSGPRKSLYKLQDEAKGR